MDLQEYERVKFDLAELLRGATTGFRSDNVRNTEAVRDLFARIAEDRFNLVVVGRFSRGKTSLMNAILGTDRLPTGVVPLTSVITTVAYGSEERVTLYFNHTSLFSDVPLSQLSEHITERGNPGNARGIRTAEVQLPADILRRGFFFIDTPGLGSSIMENTRTTEAFLPEADAFILVTSYDSPLSEEEGRILEMVRISGRRVFVILNKQDCLQASEREEVQAHLRIQLAAIFTGGEPDVYSVSAEQGLRARLRGDEAALASSGLLVLEEALITFLVNDRRREFLLNMCSRIEEIAAVMPAGAELSDRMRGLRTRIVEGDHGPEDPPSTSRGAALLPTVQECEICRRVADDVFSFLARYQAKLHGDNATQAELAARGGLCAPHMKQFEALAAPREVCTGFAGVLDRQAKRLRRAASSDDLSSLLCEAVQQALPTVDSCPACEVAEKAAASATLEISRLLRVSGTPRLDTLSAICLPHLEPLLQLLPVDIGRDLLNREAEILERLSDDMRRFALKQDGAKRYMASREELAAGRRGLRMLLRDPNAETGPPSLRAGSNVVRLVRPA